MLAHILTEHAVHARLPFGGQLSGPVKCTISTVRFRIPNQTANLMLLITRHTGRKRIYFGTILHDKKDNANTGRAIL